MATSATAQPTSVIAATGCDKNCEASLAVRPCDAPTGNHLAIDGTAFSSTADLEDLDPDQPDDDRSNGVASQRADRDTEQSEAGPAEHRPEPETGHVDGQVVHALAGIHRERSRDDCQVAHRRPGRRRRMPVVTSFAATTTQTALGSARNVCRMVRWRYSPAMTKTPRMNIAIDATADGWVKTCCACAALPSAGWPCCGLSRIDVTADTSASASVMPAVM